MRPLWPRKDLAMVDIHFLHQMGRAQEVAANTHVCEPSPAPTTQHRQPCAGEYFPIRGAQNLGWGGTGKWRRVLTGNGGSAHSIGQKFSCGFL